MWNCPTSRNKIHINSVFLSMISALIWSQILSELKSKTLKIFGSAAIVYHNGILVSCEVSTSYLNYNIWVGVKLKIVNQPAAGKNLPSVTFLKLPHRTVSHDSSHGISALTLSFVIASATAKEKHHTLPNSRQHWSNGHLAFITVAKCNIISEILFCVHNHFAL